MPDEKDAPDLLDLKFLPAWVKETPNENRYANFAGDEGASSGARDRRGPDRRAGGGERRDRGPRPPSRHKERRDPREGVARGGQSQPMQQRPPEEASAPAPAVEARFVPVARVLESVVTEIKSGHLAYSVFSLARMFLDKPERYDVHLQAESAALFQLGENGPVATDQRMVENGAFLSEKDRFYRTEVTQSEPIKGNFAAVARCRLSGVLLGPTNHHAYQPQLRNLYEQRFSRRMSFQEYQRQIEVVTTPEAVERWKEEARSVTTYVTLQEEAPVTFKSVAETERHFRETYLPGLLRSSAELTVDGVVSRQLSDRSLGRVIEDAWAREFRSPSKMMQELMGAFRQGALHTFRHRKGMLFVSPVRSRPFNHSSASVSASVAALLAALTENPGINRRLLQEKLLPAGADEAEGGEKKKLALASDLHWLISEGHVIEFNDGALDLARTKAPPPATPIQPNENAAVALPNDETKTEPETASQAPAPGSVPDPEPVSESEVIPEPAAVPEPQPTPEFVAAAVVPEIPLAETVTEPTDAPEAAQPAAAQTGAAVAPATESLPGT